MSLHQDTLTHDTLTHVTLTHVTLTHDTLAHDTLTHDRHMYSTGMLGSHKCRANYTCAYIHVYTYTSNVLIHCTFKLLHVQAVIL